MFIWGRETKLKGPIYDWLLAHKDEIRAGTAEYMGTPVSEATEFHQYECVVSAVAVSMFFRSPHYLPTWENGHLQLTGVQYALMSGILGWWCVPWGPLLTIRAIGVNLSGGKRRTAASLLQLLEWGWDSPDCLSPDEFRKQVLELTVRAAEAIRSRRAAGGFPDNIGVRIAPSGHFDTAVEISFDFPVSDGRDWIGESHGLLILIDKSDEGALTGCTVDFEDGGFWARAPTTPVRRLDNHEQL
jgi:hypothetical protein